MFSLFVLTVDIFKILPSLKYLNLDLGPYFDVLAVCVCESDRPIQTER